MRKPVVLLIALVAAAILAAEPPKTAEPAGLATAREALQGGQYAQALETSEKALKDAPGNASLEVIRVKALMGLHRYMDAAKVALPMASQHPEVPEFRYAAGQCALELGMVPQALQSWGALCLRDDGWASRGAFLCGRLLLAQGKRAEALDLVKKVLARLKVPGPALVRLSLELDPDVTKAKALIAKLKAADPQDAEEWEAMEKIYAAAGEGRLFEEEPLGDKEVTIPIKERSEHVNMPVFTGENTWSQTVTFSSGSRVTIPVNLGDDAKRWMMVDSGADVVLLAAHTAKELSLKPVASSEYLGMGYKGTVPSDWVFIKTLRLGDFTLHNVPAMVIDKDTDFWKEMDGILPLSLFRNHGVLYDRRHGKLSLYPPGTPATTVLGDKAHPARCLWFRGQPLVESTIQSFPKRYCLLDTGSTDTFLAAELATEVGVSVNSGKYSSQRAAGLSGGFLSGTAEKVTIGVGDMQFQLPRVQVTEIGQYFPVDCYGIIGRDILDLFEIYFDMSSGVLAFKAYDR
jgi:tetratricopeptide (TPR) repeat protein